MYDIYKYQTTPAHCLCGDKTYRGGSQYYKDQKVCKHQKFLFDEWSFHRTIVNGRLMACECFDFIHDGECWHIEVLANYQHMVHRMYASG